MNEMYQLYIANKNYSSWSLRPWVLMMELRIAFQEHLLRFGDTARWASYRSISPAGKVPCLVDGDITVWDSFSIAEYVAEHQPGVWPAEAAARAWARSAAAEMHSGFSELRNRCSMTCGVRVRLNEHPPSLDDDIRRLGELWRQGLSCFGGPFLAGAAFTAVDAFFAPVAFRVQSYGLSLDADASAYVARILALPSMQQWYARALEETFRDTPHEDEMHRTGRVLEDYRALPQLSSSPA
jgi:glutathione S-transferase